MQAVIMLRKCIALAVQADTQLEPELGYDVTPTPPHCHAL